jgi:hypothetical protein
MKCKPSGIQQEDFVPIFEHDQRSKLTTLICSITCLVFAVLEAWSQRQFINEDGVSYLDMSDAFLRHNWHLLINPIWSPLYPFLIGSVTWLTRPSALWEVPTVHIVNLAIFVAALASFEFFLRQAITVLRQQENLDDTDSTAPLPVWLWELLGYGLFAWSSVGMISAPRMLTPDLCVAIFVYLDAALLLRLRTSPKRFTTCLLLGLTLGLGYLAKAILFPMAFVLIAVAFLMIGKWKEALRPLAVTLLVFLAISAPLLVSMSERVGRFSYSEAGNINYVWHVDRFNPYSASASGPPANLKHPMIILHRNPNVFVFREPTAYTYPPRQDTEYWFAGIDAKRDLRKQIIAVGKNLTDFFADGHIMPMWLLIVAGLSVVLFSRNSDQRAKKIFRSSPLLISGIAAPGLYLLVHIEPRYVAPFFVLVLVGFFPGILLYDSRAAAKRSTVLTVAVSISVIAMTAFLVAYHLAGFPRAEDKQLNLFVHVGTALNNQQVQSGDDIAIIGDSSDGCRWARLARVRIVAQLLRGDVTNFWRSSPRKQAEVYDAFARAGAKAIVAENSPQAGHLSDWQRLDDSDYYVRVLSFSTNK